MVTNIYVASLNSKTDIKQTGDNNYRESFEASTVRDDFCDDTNNNGERMATIMDTTMTQKNSAANTGKQTPA